MRDLGRAALLDNTRAGALNPVAPLVGRSPGDPTPGVSAAPRERPRKGSRSMFWQSQGGGPWGTGPRGGGPWGGGNRGNGGGPSPRGRGPQTPDFEELLRRGQDRFRRVLPGNFNSRTWIAVVVIAIVVLWLLNGF